MLEQNKTWFHSSEYLILRSKDDTYKEINEMAIITLQNTADTKWKNWYLDLDGDADDQNGRLLLWKSLGSGAKWKMTKTGGGLVPAFPINVEQHSELEDHHRMLTKIKVSNTGRLDAWVRTWTANKTEGFRGQVIVFLLDQNGNIIWNSKDMHRYGINATGPFDNENSRNDTFTENIPPAALTRTRQAFIYHRRYPKELKEILDEVATVVKVLDQTYHRIKDTDLAKDIATATA
jgi:hypothetical protein